MMLASTLDKDGRQQGLSLHNVSKICIVTKRGLFNPYTMTGMIIVNNVSVSTNSEWILDAIFDKFDLTKWLPDMYQILLYPLRALVQVLGVDLYVMTSIPSLCNRICNTYVFSPKLNLDMGIANSSPSP